MSSKKIKKQMLCFDCKEPITSEQFVLVGESNYHLEHFVCKECKNPLTGNLYFEHNEDIYCEDDYHILFSPKCEKCLLPIKDKYLNVMNKSYHQTCFVCYKCSSIFENGQYFKQEEDPVCITCYSSQAKKCAACGEPILSKVYSALDQYWHFECFKCAKCGENFNNESFMSLDGKAYHQNCNQILCIQCELPVSGEYYQFEGTKALHKECLISYKDRKKKEIMQAKPDITKTEENSQKEVPHQIQEALKEEKNPENQVEQHQPQIQIQIEEIKKEEIKPNVEVSKTLEEPAKEHIQAQLKVEETKTEDKPKPLNKPLILDESKPIKTNVGPFLGISPPKKEKRSSVMVNASLYEVFVPEFEEKKVETLKEGFTGLNVGNSNFYPYEILTKSPYPAGVDHAKREEYLGEGDFMKVFGMKKEDFSKLPLWKKSELKKKAKLF